VSPEVLGNKRMDWGLLRSLGKSGYLGLKVSLQVVVATVVIVRKIIICDVYLGKQNWDYDLVSGETLSTEIT
jgi:hypothetical protein